jgi:hypothetical protein
VYCVNWGFRLTDDLLRHRGELTPENPKSSWLGKSKNGVVALRDRYCDSRSSQAQGFIIHCFSICRIEVTATQYPTTLCAYTEPFNMKMILSFRYQSLLVCITASTFCFFAYLQWCLLYYGVQNIDPSSA